MICIQSKAPSKLESNQASSLNSKLPFLSISWSINRWSTTIKKYLFFLPFQCQYGVHKIFHRARSNSSIQRVQQHYNITVTTIPFDIGSIWYIGEQWRHSAYQWIAFGRVLWTRPWTRSLRSSLMTFSTCLMVSFIAIKILRYYDLLLFF